MTSITDVLSRTPDGDGADAIASVRAGRVGASLTRSAERGKEVLEPMADRVRSAGARSVERAAERYDLDAGNLDDRLVERLLDRCEPTPVDERPDDSLLRALHAVESGLADYDPETDGVGETLLETAVEEYGPDVDLDPDRPIAGPTDRRRESALDRYGLDPDRLGDRVLETLRARGEANRCGRETNGGQRGRRRETDGFDAIRRAIVDGRREYGEDRRDGGRSDTGGRERGGETSGPRREIGEGALPGSAGPLLALFVTALTHRDSGAARFGGSDRIASMVLAGLETVLARYGKGSDGSGSPDDPDGSGGSGDSPGSDSSRWTITRALKALFVANLLAMSVGAWYSYRNGENGTENGAGIGAGAASGALFPEGSRSGLGHLLVYAGGSIALLFGASMLNTPETNMAVTEFWRWWVVHMWVEGAFEFFMVAVVSVALVAMDLLDQAEAEQAILFEVFTIMAAGIVGVSHHYWWVGLPDLWVHVGMTFSTLEFVPIVFVLYRAFGEYRSLAARGDDFPYVVPFLFIVGATVWNFVGAGVLGFFLNVPILNYYEHGTYLTLAHSHAATFGAFGLLALGLGTYILRVVTPEEAWNPAWFRRSFWLSNVGLAVMVVGSLLPVGFLQLETVYEEGFAAARSTDFYDRPLVQKLLWARVPGDSLVICGAFAFTGSAIRHLRRAEKSEARPART